MNRKIIGIDKHFAWVGETFDSYFTALCDDGTVWCKFNDRAWKLQDNVPIEECREELLAKGYSAPNSANPKSGANS